MLRNSLIMVAVCVTLLHDGSALAKPSPEPAQPPAGYRQLLSEALTEFEAKNWPEAKALFEKAHGLYPNARTLRGLGMVAFAARRYVDTIRYLSSALEHPTRPLTDAHRKHAQSMIDQSNTFVGRFSVALSPSDAGLLVDGQPARLEADGSLALDPGEHELVASAAAHIEAVRKLSVSGGERGSITLSLRPVVTQVAASSQPRVATSSANVAAEKLPERRPRLWTWVALGGAGAFAVAALAFHLHGQSEYDEIVKTCLAMENKGCEPRQKEQLLDDSSITTMDVLTNTGLGLAGASLITAAVLFFVEGDHGSDDIVSKSADAHARVEIGPQGVRLQGVF